MKASKTDVDGTVHEGSDIPEDVKVHLPEEPSPEDFSNFLKSWSEFAQSTSIHGIKYIFDNSYKNKPRRLFWVFVCLAVSVYFVFQLTSSVFRFYEYKTVTNTEVIYGEPVMFPAVTLCNQNNFRISTTANYKLYDYIDGVFSNFEDLDPGDYDWKSVNTTTFMNETAHQLEDFIDRCTWSGEDCDIDEDFIRVFTGIGVCYTFNGGPAPRVTRQPGSRAGLRLVLIVEQYEYMRGSQEAAGIKVLLHDPDEKPEMRDQGFVVGPGAYALVAVNQKHVTSLEPPWGTCKENTQPYQSCIADCRNRKAANDCGCRDVHMSSSTTGIERHCNINESFICIRQALEMMSETNINCDCQLKCERTLFEPSLSYAVLSEFNIDQVALTNTGRKESVRQKFLNAQETKQRVVKAIIEMDSVSMTQILNTAATLISSLDEMYENSENRRKISEVYKVVDILSDQFDPRGDFTHLRNRFLELGDIRTGSDELTFASVRTNFKTTIDNLMHYNKTESDSLMEVRRCVSLGMNGTEDYHNICQHTPCDSLMETYCFVNNLTTIPDFIFEHSSKIDMIVEAQSLVSEIETYKDTVNLIFADGVDRVKHPEHYECLNIIDQYEHIILSDYINFLDSISTLKDISSLQEAEILFSSFEIMINTNLSVYFLKNDSATGWILPPTDSQVETVCSWYIEAYDRDNTNFDKTLNRFKTFLVSEVENLNEVFDDTVTQLSRLREIYSKDLNIPIGLFQNYLTEEITKKGLSEVISSPSLTLALVNMKTATEDLKAAIANFVESYELFIETYTDYYEMLTAWTWPFITNANKDGYQFLQLMMEWYNTLGGKQLLEQYLGITGELNGFTFEANTTFTEWNIWLATTNAVKGFQTDFLPATGFDGYVTKVTQSTVNEAINLRTQLETMISQLQIYQQKLVMDTDFYMNNFLQLDIFYKDLSLQDIEQQKAFEFESLLGEIEGFLGLLLGASVITVCELIDYFIREFLRKRKKKIAVEQMSRISSGISRVDVESAANYVPPPTEAFT